MCDFLQEPVVRSGCQHVLFELVGVVERGKPRKAAVVACMAKLLKIIYGVLIHRHPFTQSTAAARQPTPHLL